MNQIWHNVSIKPKPHSKLVIRFIIEKEEDLMVVYNHETFDDVKEYCEEEGITIIKWGYYEEIIK